MLAHVQRSAPEMQLKFILVTNRRIISIIKEDSPQLELLLLSQVWISRRRSRRRGFQIPGSSLLRDPWSLRRLLRFASAADESLGLRNDVLPRVAHRLGVADGGVCKGKIIPLNLIVGSFEKGFMNWY